MYTYMHRYIYTWEILVVVKGVQVFYGSRKSAALRLNPRGLSSGLPAFALPTRTGMTTTSRSNETFKVDPIWTRETGYKTGGTGVTSNRYKEVHRGSDSVFYSLI